MRTYALMLLLPAVCLTPVRETRAQANPMQTQIDRLSAALKKADSTISRLEARISKLERDGERKDTDLKDEAEKALEEKTKAEVERRLSALERAPSPGKGNSGSGSQVVRAPFIVEDSDGSPILRVTGGKSPRLFIGEEKGGSVEIGTGSAGGGIVRVRDASSTDRVILLGSEGMGQVRALSANHSAVLTSGDAQVGATLGLFVADVPTARLQSGRTGYGAFTLTDPSGTERVWAGSLASGCKAGTLMTGPKKRPGTMGPTSIVQGAC